MRFIKSYFLLLLVPLIGFGQSKADTLRKKIHDSDINKRVEACSELAWELRNTNSDTAMFYAMKSESWLNDQVSALNKAYAYHIVGSLYSAKGDYKEAIPWLEKAYNIRKTEKDELQLIATVINLVYCSQGIGDIKKTLNYAFESEQLCDRVTSRDPHLYIMTVNQLADVYAELKRYDKSDELYKKAIALAEKRQKDEDLSLIYQNYGAYLINREKFEEALPYLEKGIKHEEKLNDPADLFTAKVNLAIVYAETGRKEEARKIFTEVYEYYKKSGSEYDRSTSSNNLAFFYVTEEKYKEAIQLFFESLDHAKKAKAARLAMQRYQMLSECYEAIKDFESALKYRKQYIDMKDSLFNQETVKQLNELTEKYGAEKKERKILELQKNNAEIKLKEEEALQESRRNSMIFGGLMFFILVIAVFIYYSFLQKKKANAELTVKNKQIAHQHLLLEEKQKEVYDSINYAGRIQKSLMATEKYIEKKISELKKLN